MDGQISKKYHIDKHLGKGAYGVVWKAVSKRSGRTVAVKRIYDAFRNRIDAQRTFREIIFLREFSDHPNIIKLLNVHRAENNTDLYLVFEFMNTDLHHVIRKGNILLDVHRRFITYQLLAATRYLHSGGVIHRDLKPSNVLLDSECNCKVADFGLARSLTSVAEVVGEDGACLTDYVATRWYRAPEILLGDKDYTTGVDIWSLGCILAEMLLQRPLFPGKSTTDQRQRICIMLQHNESRLKNLLAGQDDEGTDLVRKLLDLQPSRRISAADGLTHPYVVKFHSEKNVKVKEEDVVPPFDDNVQLSVDEYRQKLYELISAQKRAKKLQQQRTRS